MSAREIRTYLDILMETISIPLREDLGHNYLYHSTQDAETAKAILHSGLLKAGDSNQGATDQQVKGVKTVSFSRNLQYAVNGKQVNRDYQVVFVIDRDILAQRYKIISTSQRKNQLNPRFTKRTSFIPNANVHDYNLYKWLSQFDANLDNHLAADEIEKWNQQTGGRLMGCSLQSRPSDVQDLYGDLAKDYNTSKSAKGTEYEEVVPTESGNIPLKGILVGFYLVPGKQASKDPELLNNPWRLEMPRPNQFVRSNKA